MNGASRCDARPSIPTRKGTGVIVGALSLWSWARLDPRNDDGPARAGPSTGRVQAGAQVVSGSCPGPWPRTAGPALRLRDARRSWPGSPTTYFTLFSLIRREPVAEPMLLDQLGGLAPVGPPVSDGVPPQPGKTRPRSWPPRLVSGEHLGAAGRCPPSSHATLRATAASEDESPRPASRTNGVRRSSGGPHSLEREPVHGRRGADVSPVRGNGDGHGRFQR